MKEEYYFLIATSEDGIYIRKILKKEIDSYLEESTDIKFLDDFPQDNWSKKREVIKKECYPQPAWEGKQQEYILIKGSFVVPKPVEVVKKLIIE